jgi:hypothetical protein
MGFLNNLLNPIKHVRNSLDSTKHLLHGDFKGAVAASPLINQGTSSPKTPVAAAALGGPSQLDPSDPSQYAGDPSDPAYGSFTNPFTVEDFYDYADPGYAFELQQGTQSLMNGASAGSGAAGGAALKDLLTYSQNFARGGFNDAFNRYQVQQGNIYNRLRDIATIGQSAAAGVGANGTALAGNAGQFTSNAGSAAGAGYVGAGNAVNNGLTNYWLMQNFKPQPAAAGVGAV